MTAPHSATNSRPMGRASLRIAVLLVAGLVLGSTGQAGDILRGGATATSSRNNAAARANAGAEAADASRTRAQDRLARTTQAITAVRRMQQGAASALVVPDGLVPGGLQRATGLNARWDGANAPNQNGNTVTIKQTESQAILHWETFNVGRNTTLRFDQSAGNSDAGKWIAFNKVFDPTGVPSKILGSIKAEGQVYILNRNGIIFGAGSQVNARTLVASSLPINDNLVERGLLNQESGNVEFLFSALPSDGFDGFSPNGPVGDVVVERGASLSSPVSAEGYGGRVMLAGANVRNDGLISTPAGQTILAAGLQVGIEAHSTSDPSLRGLDVYVGAVADAGLGISGGTAKNTGLIEIYRGNLFMTGRNVLQNGIVDSSTSVDLNGRIDLIASYDAVPNVAFNPTQPGLGGPFLSRSTGLVDLGADSVMRILPEWDSLKTIAASSLPLRSAVNIQGKTVHMSPGSMLLAPNAKVEFQAGQWVFEPSATTPRSTFVYSGGQIFLDDNTLIDVSGSTDIFIPLAHHIMTLQLRGSELADSPLQRSANLRAVNLTLDLRRRGSYFGNEWVGTPLGDASGYLNLIERNVGQLTLEGGDVALRAGGSVVVRNGSTIDASGGYVRNEEGMVQTTRLKLGRYLINIENATPDRIYDGIYDGMSTTTSQKWGISKTFASPLAPLGAYNQREYIAGANAGTIVISAPSMAIDGDLRAGRIIGPRQMRDSLVSSSLPQAGRLELRFEAQDNDPARAVNKFGLISPTPPKIIFQEGSRSATSPGFSFAADDSAPALPADRVAEVTLSPSLLDDDRFGSLLIRNGDGGIVITNGTTLRVPVGGELDFTGANIFINGDILAPGGNINFVASTFSPYVAGFLNASAGDVLPPPNPQRGIIRLAQGALVSAAGQIHDDRPTGQIGSTAPIAKEGGSVTFEAYTVDLLEGSHVDVSGGIAYGADGKYAYGNAGAIALFAGQDPNLKGILGGELHLDGQLSGFSGASGGSLSLKAALVRVGGGVVPEGSLLLQPDFFNQGGFSRFEITGIGALDAASGETIPGVLISEGTVLAPVVQSAVAVPFARGGNPSFRPVLKPVGLRDPVSLTFAATGAVDSLTSLPIVRGDLVMAAGTRITTDPGGEVQLLGETVSVAGTIETPGGRIVIAGADAFPEVTKGPTALPTVYLAPTARLSAAGTSVLLPDPFGRRRGYVLPGGSVEISGNILAETGAVLDVSGAADSLDFTPGELGLIENPRVPANSGVNAPLYSLQTIRTRVESNGGSISLHGSELLLSDATLLGNPGGPTALGGFLSISSGRYVALNEASTSADINLTVQQSGNSLAGGGNGIGRPVFDATGSLVKGGGFFSVDTFVRGGFSALELGGNVRFRGPVSIQADRAILLADGGVVEADSPVKLTAPYIRVGQKFPLPLLPDQQLSLFIQTDIAGVPSEYHPVPTSGPGNLQLNAQLIDVGTLVLQGISEAQFSAPGGDIRGNGTFVMAGNLRLNAGQVYPTTAANFDIFVYDNTLTSAPGSIVVEGGGTRPLPLSAGGSLRLMASIIEQGGTLRAPLGNITLGWDGILDEPENDVVGPGSLATPVTSLLTLTGNSVTSVSAVDPTTGEGLLIPFGKSPDGLVWLDPTGFDVTLAGLTPKGISLAGQNIVTASGSTIDIRGGGDLYAYRWVQGLGGFDDILAHENAFAILPNYGFNYAPYAPFNTTADQIAGDPGYANSKLQVGDQITLKGSAALPAGTYTLLPARYALLPGAVLVETFDDGNVASGDPLARFRKMVPGSIALENGTYLVGGKISNRLTPSMGIPATSTTFRVLSHESVRQQSEYEDFYANDFLRAAAVAREQDPQRLPADAGKVQFFSAANLSLSGRVLASAAAGGRGGMADISVPGTISITGGGASPTPGSVELKAALLSSWGIESLLIGGSRAGDALTVRSSGITVDTRGTTLSSPEVILAGTSFVTLADGARVVSSGGLTQPATTYQIVGDGALVRVSGRTGASILRTGFANTPGVVLNIGENAVLSGASLTLDSTYDTNLSPTALLLAQEVNLNSGRISILLDDPGAANPAFGLVLEGSALESLSNAGRLNLLSYSSLDFYGHGDVPFGDPASLALSTGAIRGFNTGGLDIRIAAGDLLLDNSQGATNPGTAALLPGALVLDVTTLRIGNNTIEVSGFSDLDIFASGGIFGSGIGGLSTQGNLTADVPVIAAASGARQFLTALGDLTITDPGTSGVFDSGLGATYSFTGQNTTVNADIIMPSGSVNVFATAGDVTIGGLIDVSGRALPFFDITSYTDGGEVVLSAVGGDVSILSGGIDVSAPAGGGDAGEILVSAPSGNLLLSAPLRGSAGVGGAGGRFAADLLDAGGLSGIDLFNVILDDGGFFESRAFRIRTGDVAMAGNATARSFSLFVDQGRLDITGSIDASGATGGMIHLAAHDDLTIGNGALLTVEGADFDHAGKGGAVVLEAGTTLAGVAGTGVLAVEAGSKIDLSVLSNDLAGPGTSAFFGKLTGTLHLRAPQTASSNNLLLAPLDGTIEDASAILVEGFRVTNLSNPSGSQITAAIRSAIQANGNTFGGNIGTLATPGSMTATLLANNMTLAGRLVIVPGAEIVNSTGLLTLPSDWNLATYRFGPRSAPGVLTIRAAKDLIFEGSLSDGFTGGSSLWASPLMAYNPLLPVNAQTWSYRLTAGADTGSANFGATGVAGSLKLGRDYGNATVSGGNSAYTPDYVASRYQAIRTGSGNISIAAATDVQLLNQFAVIYTAGTRLASASSIYAPGDFEIPHLVPDSGPTSVSDNYLLGKQQLITTAQYSVAGGNISITAGSDVARLTRNASGLIDDSSRQLPMNWLYRRSFIDPETGEYGRSGVKFTTSGSRYVDDPSSSTTWWIDYTNFFEGIGTLGGGNISITAGRDIRNIDAVAPTNARAPRGVADSSLILELGGGDISLVAGKDITGGVYYVERGQGTLKAGGEITTNQTRSISLGIVGSSSNLNNPQLLDNSTWLPTTFFVGKGGFDVSARGNVLLGPVANPFLLPQGIGNKYWYKTYFNTYGAESYLNATSLGGDVTLRLEATLPSFNTSQPILGLWMDRQNTFSTQANNSGRASNTQPWLRLSETSTTPFTEVFGLMAPNLGVSALSGSIQLSGDVTLFPSATGGLKMVAAGNIFGLSATGLSSTVVSGAQTAIWTASTVNVSDTNPKALPGIASAIDYFSTQARDLSRPPNGDLPTAQVFAQTSGDFLGIFAVAFGESGSYSGFYGLSQTKQALHAPGILHTGDTEPVRLYAAAGDITGLTLYSPKATQITAGNDISDVAFYLQNITPDDISFVSAGRDIIPNNPNTISRQMANSSGNLLALGESALPGDLQIAGPGSLQVLAGRDLDLGTGAVIGSDLGVGITSIGNARNPYLPFAGADIYLAAGIGESAGLGNSILEVDAFLDEYFDEYGSELTEGGEPVDRDGLSDGAQAQLALRLLGLILRDSGREATESADYSVGYDALASLFGKSSEGGDILIRARDVRTKNGGQIVAVAPGGSLSLAQDAGSVVALRPTIENFAGTDGLKLVSNSPVTAAPSGIVTEYGGGISVITDGDVEIGSGRIFTLRGGNIVIWSSAGDIAAGAASKTVATAPPTRVLIDPQTATVETDLSGLATGGGIGVLSTVEGVEPGDVDLIAPVGTVDAGDAGIRASGNLNIAAAAVLNADNISAGGASVGVPAAAVVAAPNIAGLTSASNASGAASSAANQVANQARPQPTPDEAPSIIVVEVLGYGGEE